jgi:hypothetical protein
MKRLLLNVLLPLCYCLVNAQIVPARKPIMPIQPVDLIKFLPAAPGGWEMKESKAKSFYNEWLVSQANREFVQRSHSNSTGNPPQPTTRLRLTDTGYNPALFGDFDQFKSGKHGNTESFSVTGFPARRVTFSGGERLRILINARFVVEVETRNQAPDASMLWVRQFNLSQLSALPDSSTEKLPNPVTVVSIDELNPRANGSYQVSWSTQGDLDAARQRKPQ